MTLKTLAVSAAIFATAAVLEIGGGWLVWRWVRDGKAWWIGLLGGLMLMAYGLVPTLQPAHFSRAYAAYGGVFVVGSLLWGWYFDGNVPDAADSVGAGLCLLGVAVIMYWPRG